MSAVDTDIDDEEGGGAAFLSHLPAIIKQRRWLVFAPLIPCALLGLGLAFALPATYRSTATLLVESQQLPTEVAGGTTDDVIDQRIAKIRQEVLSRPDLIEIIQQANLYPKDRASKPLSEVVQKMRDATTVAPVDAVIDKRSGQSKTIAFSMSFDYPEAIVAQTVIQEFVQRFLKIDSDKSAEQAANTVIFLSEQAGTLQGQIQALDNQVSLIKARNGLVLSSAGVTMLGGGGGGYEGQIAMLQNENSQLQAQRNLVSTAATRDPIVQGAENALAAARAVYAEGHPDVILAKQRLAEAKKLADKNAKNIPTDQIASQIASNNRQIAALNSARSADSSRTASVIAAQSRAPVIIEQVNQLTTRADGLRLQLQSVQGKLMTAQASARMENEQKGERLSVIDPPVVPDKPVSPNRPLLMFGGAIAGLLLGLFLALAMEFIRRPIRGVAGIRDALGMPPLVVIPLLRADGAQPRGWRAWRAWLRPRWPFRRRAEALAA